MAFKSGRADNLERARKARQEKAQTEQWQSVKAHKDINDCRCDLRPGMTWAELLELEEGCTEERGYICPTLDLYRRLVGYTPPSRRKEAADRI